MVTDDLKRWAALQPNAPALTLYGGQTWSYAETLDIVLRVGAYLQRGLGLSAGQHIAILAGNCPEFLFTSWAAERSGLHWTPVDPELGADAASYVVRNCDARVLVANEDVADLAIEVANRAGARVLLAGGERAGCASFAAAMEQFTAADHRPVPGRAMPYSSGTTGRPKGVYRPLPQTQPSFGDRLDEMLRIERGTRVLVAGPLVSMSRETALAGIAQGAEVVLMADFGETDILAAVERHHIGYVQLNPSQMVRLLKLPPEVHGGFDLSSLRAVLSGAAPCPVDTKRAMMVWLGPILWEYYGSNEGVGGTLIGPTDWLDHPGSVGRPWHCRMRIVGPDGAEVPDDETGTVCFSGRPRVEYYGDPDRTAALYDGDWARMPDIGYVTEGGWLYLTDRSADLINRGGHNVATPGVEGILIQHPAVRDVGVIGVADEELGEEVLAVVELVDPTTASEQLRQELVAYARVRDGRSYPRIVVFGSVPRTTAGKLRKDTLRDQYGS